MSFEKQFKLLATKEAEIQRLRSETEQKLSDFDQQLDVKLKERLRQSPLKALEEAGWTFEDLAKAVIAGDEKSYERETKSPYVRQLQEKIDTLESRLNQTDQQREYQNDLGVLQKSIKSNTEEYPLVARTPQADQVLYNMFVSARDRGEQLTIESALEGLEAHLLEQRNLYMDVPKYQTDPKPSAKQQSKKPPVIHTVPKEPYTPSPSRSQKPMSLQELLLLQIGSWPIERARKTCRHGTYRITGYPSDHQTVLRKLRPTEDCLPAVHSLHDDGEGSSCRRLRVEIPAPFQQRRRTFSKI